MKISDTQFRALGWIALRGGKAELDKHGRAIIDGAVSWHPAEVWPDLTLLGLLEGNNEFLKVSPLGEWIIYEAICRRAGIW